MHEKPHGCDLRKGRFSEAGRLYFITFVTKDRKPLFENFLCARKTICILNTETGVESLAFVLMPDHVHWLIGLTRDLTLKRVVKSVKGRSAQEVNRVLNRTGPVWQPGYYDHALRRQEDVIEIARYIVGNPLRAGFVTRLGDYPHWDAVWLDRE